MLYPFPPLLEDSVIERASRLNSTLICDGMKAVGIPGDGCMESAVNAIHPSMKVVGTAVTVETADGDNFPIHVASYSAPRAGYVMVIDGKGYMGRAYLGELILGACKAMGYLGVVLDGCSRDYDGNVAMGYPVFSKGLMPRGPIKKDPGNINGPIQCAGIQVNPGDLVVGDCDGVCVVPRERIDEVLTAAEEKQAYEEKRVAAIAAYNEAARTGQPLPQLAPQWVLDMLNEQ